MKASGTGARMEGVMNPLLGDMMATAALQVSAKSKGRTARAGGGEPEKSDSDEDEEESGTESNDGDEDPQSGDRPTKKAKTGNSAKGKGGGKGKSSWYDAETQNLKAEKVFKNSLKSLKNQMDEVSNSMSAAVAEFRGVPSDAQAGSKLLALDFRIELLRCLCCA